MERLSVQRMLPRPERRLRLWAGALVLGALACVPPVPAPPKNQGHPIERATLDAMRQGLTTRTEAIQALGQPSRTTRDAGAGTTSLAWDYVRSDAQGVIAISTLLVFGPDDRLVLKMVNQQREIIPGPPQSKPANPTP